MILIFSIGEEGFVPNNPSSGFSKEMIVAIFIFLESSYIELDVDYRSFSS